VKLEILSNIGSLCDQCVALCCRYFAFQIEKPTTQRDFDDLRWYMLHEDTIIFVEDGQWYIQINRKCKALLPDNRCGIYENRPTICREYTTESCDWHGDEYDYDELFTEPEQIERYAKEYLAKKRRRSAARKRRDNGKAATKPSSKSGGSQTKPRAIRARGAGAKPAGGKSTRGKNNASSSGKNAKKRDGAAQLRKSA
jgi:Fe-S-cluster containining protein